MPGFPVIEQEEQMEISRNATTAKGPAETFTGDVWVDPITRGLPPSQLNVAAVRFTPGARTAWHSHDGGQTLYVTEGRGLVQARGLQITELNPGDVVFAPDGEEHWHGASPDHFMTGYGHTRWAPSRRTVAMGSTRSDPRTARVVALGPNHAAATTGPGDVPNPSSLHRERALPCLERLTAKVLPLATACAAVRVLEHRLSEECA